MEWFGKQEEVSKIIYNYVDIVEGDLFDKSDIISIMNYRNDIIILREQATEYFGFKWLDIEIFYVWKYHSGDMYGIQLRRIASKPEDNMKFFVEFLDHCKDLGI